LDAKSGKTKKRISKVTPLFKTCIAFTVSDNGTFLVGLLTSGDLFVWNRDVETLRHISGMNEFAIMLGLNVPSVFVSDDASKILLITCRNKIFVWEMDGASGGGDGLVGHCGIARNNNGRRQQRAKLTCSF
jgi:hypothetical protein